MPCQMRIIAHHECRLNIVVAFVYDSIFSLNGGCSYGGKGHQRLICSSVSRLLLSIERFAVIAQCFSLPLFICVLVMA